MKKIFLFILALSLMMSFVSAQGLVINSPDSGSSFNKKVVSFDLSADVESNFYYINNIDARGSWVILCAKKLSCVKSITLKEGDNKLTIKAVDASGTVETEEITVSVDTKKLFIKKTTPAIGFVSKGEFTAEVNKDLDSITLNYGNSYYGFKTMDADCVEKVCKATITDLETFEGQELVYWFSASDDFGNNAASREVSLKVDTTDPVIKYVSENSDNMVRRTLRLVFEVDEMNFDRIRFIDGDEAASSWKVLCTRLDSGRCARNIILRKGKHKIKFEVQDKAGNSAQETISEFVVA